MIVPNAARPADVSSTGALRNLIGQAVADVLQHQNSLKRAGAVARLIAVAQQLIQQAETEERLASIEERLDTIKLRVIR